MERHHDGNNQEEENFVIEGTEPTEHIEIVRRDTTKDSMTLQTVLEEAGVGSLFLKFSSEGIDIKLLLDLNQDDFRRMLKDLDINWGDRYKIEKQVELVRKSNKPIAMEDGTPKDISADTTNLVNVTLAEVPDMVNENGKEVGPCKLCYEAAKQDNPQHKCRKCSNVVCSILCSIPDPESDNEMHRVHKHGDYRCIGAN